MADAHRNFAKGTLTNSPGTAGTSFVLQSGEGARFAANMPVTIVPANTQPDSSTAEIGYVTNVSTDTLTVTRAQESTTAKNAVASWNVFGSITAKSLTDIETDVAAKAAAVHTHAQSDVTGLTTALAGKESTITAGTSSQYYRGDKTMQTLNQDAVPDGTTNKAFTATEKTKLAGIASGATANSADATLLARANHTGTQTASTISDFNTAADARITAATGVSVQGYNANTTTLGNTTTGTGSIVRAASPTFSGTVSGITKSMVGLGNVDNTSDASKPVSTATQALFDAQTTIYGTSQLRKFRAAMANVSSSPVDIVFIGDSKTEGTGASAGNRWIEVFRDSYRIENNPSNIPGGFGYVPGAYVTPSLADAFTLSGSATVQTSPTADTLGLGKRSIQMTGSAGSATITTSPSNDYGAITGFSVIYTQNSSQGVFTVAVDGGAAVTVTATNATEVIGQRYTVTGLEPSTSHTIVISRTSGTVNIEGIMLYNKDESAGIRIWDSAQHAMKAADVNNTTHKWWKALTTIDPDLVYYQLGRNDISNGATAATITSYIQTQIAHIRSLCTVPPSIILGVDWEDLYNSPTDTYANYRAALYTIARNDTDIAVFDTYPLIGTVTTSGQNTLGLVDTDLIHGTARGNSVIAAGFRSMLERLVQPTKRQDGVWRAWVPTFTQNDAMTITPTAINYARYMTIGNTAFFKLNVTFTVGGTPDAYMQVYGMPVLPRQPGQMLAVGGGFGFTPSLQPMMCHVPTTAPSYVNVSTPTGTAWTAGTGRQVVVEFNYEF